MSSTPWCWSSGIRRSDEQVVADVLEGQTALFEVLMSQRARITRARAALRHDLMARTRSSAPETFRSYRPRCDSVVAKVLPRIAQ